MKRRNGLEEDDDSAKLCGIPGVLFHTGIHSPKVQIGYKEHSRQVTRCDRSTTTTSTPNNCTCLSADKILQR